MGKVESSAIINLGEMASKERMKNERIVSIAKSMCLACMNIVAYVWLLRDYIFSIYYSMPANDDFALGINWWGKNILGEAISRAWWNYNNWGGQSGMVAVLVQVFFNPLYWCGTKGHAFSICMLIANGIILFGIIEAIKGFIENYFEIENQIVVDVVCFLIIAVISTSHYYNDVYNWWSGLIGYAFMLMLSMQTINFECKYLKTGSKYHYGIMVALGILACSSVMNCAFVGALYIFLVMRDFSNQKGKIVTLVIPLCCYISSGVLTVAAPGNRVRMLARPGEVTSASTALRTSFELIHYRLTTTFEEEPIVKVLLALILIMGFFISKRAVRFRYILLGGLLMAVVCSASILPYVYGQSKTLDAEFAPRAMYVFDYYMFIGLSMLLFSIGGLIAQVNVRGAAFGKVFVVLVPFSFALYVLPSVVWENIIQKDIEKDKAVIIETFEVWNDIFQEFAEATEGSSVVALRPELTWTPYFYYPGVDDEICDPIQPGEGYANCNQSVAKYFGMSRVSVVFE